MNQSLMLRLLKILVLTIVVAALAACGGSGSGGSSSTGGGTNTNDTNDDDGFFRPLVEKRFEFEKELRGVFVDGYEEHIYEIIIDNPSMLEIQTNAQVYASYYSSEKWWPTNISPIFYLVDSEFEIIGSIQKTNYNSNAVVSDEFELGRLGVYYIIVSFPLYSPTEQPYKNLDSRTSQYEYFLTVKNQNTETIIYGTEGRDIIRGYDADQYIYGEAGNDILYGMKGNDYIYGGEGDDVIYGGDGRDYIYGGEGDDTLYGNSGNDYIEGGEGNDIIYGGAGADHLVGGPGRDTFVYENFSDSGTSALTRDVIEDFTPGEDFIDLSKIRFGGSASNKFTVDAIYNGKEPPSDNIRGVLWLLNGVLYGKAALSLEYADFSIALPNVTSLSREDFIF